MRMRELFLASILTVTFGCPGGDDGETDANTTMADTSNETEPGESSSGGGGETSSGGGEESTTAAEGGESTTAAEGDSTTSSEGESSTGGVSEECVSFCEAYFMTCGDNAGNDYGDQGGCETACTGFSEEGFGCRRMHLMLAMDGDPDTHCPHASDGGGGVCN